MRFNQVLLWKIYGKLIKEIILTLMIYLGIQLWMLFGFYIKQCMLKGMEHMIKMLLIEADDQFKNKETKYAGFATFRLSASKWKGSIGLRYEYIHAP